MTHAFQKNDCLLVPMNHLLGQSVGLNDAIYLNMHENVITEQSESALK